ncbi:unnamed protein product [Prunus armeniaca]
MTSFTHFKGDSDLESHLKHFKSVMILYKAEDVLICKLQGASFRLHHGVYFLSDDKKELYYLFNLCKKHDKSLRDYIKRFKTEKANIVGCDDLYRELTIAPSQTLIETGQRGDKPSNQNCGGKRKAPSQGGAPGDEGYTKFTIPIHQILAQVKDKPWLRRPPTLNRDHDKRSINKYCAFHGTHGHDTANYRSWKMHLEELVKEGHYTEFMAKKAIQ